MKKFLSFFCTFLVLAALLVSGTPVASAALQGKNVTILFTHDMHDHMLPFNILQDGKVQSLGGYARIESAVKEEKKNDPNLLLLDAGDFSMGTLFQTMYAGSAPELRILGQMGYDVVTLGNHEFDYRPEGLTSTLNAAKKSGDKVPQIVASNIVFPSEPGENPLQSLTDLKNAMDNYGVKDYTVIERNGIKIGIFGLMGKDADESAPMAGVKFANIAESAKRAVNALKQKENVDLIICLSHSGTWEDKSSSEDEILAKEVPGIDVIISGHTHTKLLSPIVVGKTIIGSCGEYGENLGEIKIIQGADNSWSLGSYKLIPADSSLPSDTAISQTIDGFKETVQKGYLDSFGLTFDQVLANTPFNFTPASNIGKEHNENILGSLISDSYIYSVQQAEGANYQPITAAIVPCGIIRGSFVKGDITVSDVFNACSLGIGPDGIPGYPLISVYLTGRELKTVCEVDASVTSMMSTAQLYMSGISFTFNPNRLIFNKVTDVSLQKKDGTLEQIDDSKLYRVVVDLYSAQMLSAVGSKSFGLLSIVPKTSDGKPVTDFEAQIIKVKIGVKDSELKQWVSVAEYLESFDKVNGIPQVMQYYSQTHGRKVVNNDASIGAVLGRPNTIAIAVYAIIVVILALIVFVIYRIATHKKRKQRKLARKKAKSAGM